MLLEYLKSDTSTIIFYLLALSLIYLLILKAFRIKELKKKVKSITKGSVWIGRGYNMPTPPNFIPELDCISYTVVEVSENMVFFTCKFGAYECKGICSKELFVTDKQLIS